MDTKALAKSKRAHSLHHSKKHSHHQASKVVPSINPSAASNSKKAAGKQVEVKPQQHHGSRTLPSNWDRYGEGEFDLDSGSTAQEGTNQPSEFVEPKSKGADYSYLILEAQAQAQAQSNYSLDRPPLFRDFDDDFTQDFGPLLSAKGKSILSWMVDDIFEIESQTSTGSEAAFLSLNLNALAEQLAKAKPSDRLFLEPDLLSAELLDEELQECGEEEFNRIESCSSAVEADSVASSAEGLNPVKQTEDEFFKSPIMEHINVEDSSSSKSAPKFEATTAEAELDMLLNSFSEPTTPFENVKKGASVMKPANIDDAIDILLEETCDLKIDSGRFSGVVKPLPDIPPALPPSSKFQLMDDFDSWLDTI